MFFAPAKISSLGFYFNSLIYVPIGVKLLKGQIRAGRGRGADAVEARRTQGTHQLEV